MFINKTILSTIRSSVKCSSTIRVYSYFPSELKVDDDKKSEKEKNKRVLKKWRKSGPENEPDLFSSLLDFTEIRDNALYRKKIPTNPSELVQWYKNKQLEYKKWSQRYIAERHGTLGKDLAISHYIVHRGGRIRRKGHTDYITPKEFENMPNHFDPLWLVEEIDASRIDLYYEALDNFKDLNRLKIVSFKGNPNFDDWCLERILAICPNIEHLDVSDCEKVTERAMEGLYRNWNLKSLVITDFNQTVAFELTVMLLEDSMPDLKIIVKQPTNKIPEETTKT